MQKLFIITNESIFRQGNKFYCDNIDLKSNPESLNKSFEVNLIARSSKFKRSHKINIPNISVFKSFFSYIFNLIIISRRENIKYLIISISPYTFFACVFLKLLGKKPIVYLRSDGFKEYKSILGFTGSAIYFFMFNIVALISNIISCSKIILRGKKGFVLNPSQLDEDWFKNIKVQDIKIFKLLYVGRLRVEKGIFSLLEMIKDKNDFSLTIVGEEQNISNKINQKNILIKKIQNDKKKLIKIYDDHNIFILPSYTEGYPMVLLESLARQRPVVIFEDIKHIKNNQKGIFVCKRNYDHLKNTLNFIKKNYSKINNDLKKNSLPTKKTFIDNFVSYLNKL